MYVFIEIYLNVIGVYKVIDNAHWLQIYVSLETIAQNKEKNILFSFKIWNNSINISGFVCFIGKYKICKMKQW